MKQHQISINNLEFQAIELEDHRMKWLFEFEEGIPPSKEHRDQIWALNKKAAKYLWDYEGKMRIGIFYPEIGKYFKNVIEYEDKERKEKELKKWLFNLGIPFKHKVFISFQPDSGFILTWKMVIKYCSKLFFAYDLILFDKSLNWGLFYHHDELFHFGKNRIYNAEIEGQKILRDANLIAEWKKKI
ncbi:MAG: hypothetical protein AB8F94_17490 [Saprospiraceae bacterium]